MLLRDLESSRSNLFFEKTVAQRGCQLPKVIQLVGSWGRTGTHSSFILDAAWPLWHHTDLGLLCRKWFLLVLSAPPQGLPVTPFSKASTPECHIQATGPLGAATRQFLWPAWAASPPSRKRTSFCLCLTNHLAHTFTKWGPCTCYPSLKCQFDLDISLLLDSVRYYCPS